MLTYLKYELKSTRKFIAMLVLAVIVSTIGLQSFALNSLKYGTEVSDFISIPILIIMGAALVYFIFLINLMKKDLYEDKGYLTFNLPLRGHEILISKILCGFIYYVVIFLVVLIVNFLVARFITFPEQTSLLIDKSIEGFSMFIEQLKIEGNYGNFMLIVIRTILFAIVSSILGLSTLYTSLIIGKTFIKKKKFSSLWFIIYIFLNFIITKIFSTFSAMYGSNFNENSFSYDAFPLFTGIDIGATIIVSIVLIAISSWLLESKVEI